MKRLTITLASLFLMALNSCSTDDFQTEQTSSLQTDLIKFDIQDNVYLKDNQWKMAWDLDTNTKIDSLEFGFRLNHDLIIVSERYIRNVKVNDWYNTNIETGQIDSYVTAPQHYWVEYLGKKAIVHFDQQEIADYTYDSDNMNLEVTTY